MPIPEITNSSGMPQVAPKAMKIAAMGYSRAAFTGNSPGPKITAPWNSTSPATTRPRSRSSSPRRVDGWGGAAVSPPPAGRTSGWDMAPPRRVLLEG